MIELPDFTDYEPIELAQVRKGDVVAAVLDGTIAHGRATYARKDSIDLDSGFNATTKGDYQFFRAPKRFPKGDCAVIEYTVAGTASKRRAVLMGGSWLVFDEFSTGVWSTNLAMSPDEMKTAAKSDYTTIFEGVK